MWDFDYENEFIGLNTDSPIAQLHIKDVINQNSFGDFETRKKIAQQLAYNRNVTKNVVAYDIHMYSDNQYRAMGLAALALDLAGLTAKSATLTAESAMLTAKSANTYIYIRKRERDTMHPCSSYHPNARTCHLRVPHMPR